jgi:hypothetical protein
MLDRQLVEACLYNFLGYGNINGRYWFIGTEEGGAEIWRPGIGTKTHEESLSVRKSFMPSMDLRHVWEDCYGIPLEGFQGPTVWRYIAAFLIYAEGCPSDEEIRSKISCFLFKKQRLGSPNGNHFLGELYPLPKESKNSIKRYKDFWQTVQEYHTEVKDRRLDLFTTALKNSPDVRFIVSYEETASQLLRKHFAVADEIRKEVPLNVNKGRYFHRSKITMPDRQPLELIETPFFGQGRLSYRDIREIVRHVEV